MGQCSTKADAPVADVFLKSEILHLGWVPFTDQNRPVIRVYDQIRFTADRTKVYKIESLESKQFLWILKLIQETSNTKPKRTFLSDTGTQTADIIIKMSNTLFSRGGVEWCPNTEISGQVSQRKPIE